MKDSLGDRMKANYEKRDRHFLQRRTPVVIRVDGKAFHTYTRGLQRPFDASLTDTMLTAASKVFADIAGCKLAYTQSDEVSFLITDYDKLETEAWFDYNQSKLESVTASLMTGHFAAARQIYLPDHNKLAFFDARAFNLPENEIANYFLWRAKDWERNSLQMYASAFFSHKELHGKNRAAKHEMLHTIGKNWTTDLEDRSKNGVFLYRKDGEIRYDSSVQPVWEVINTVVKSVIY